MIRRRRHACSPCAWPCKTPPSAPAPTRTAIAGCPIPTRPSPRFAGCRACPTVACDAAAGRRTPISPGRAIRWPPCPVRRSRRPAGRTRGGSCRSGRGDGMRRISTGPTRMVRLGDLLQLEQIASGHASRERFLTELTLHPPDAVCDQAGAPHLDEEEIVLSTIHSGKGGADQRLPAERGGWVPAVGPWDRVVRRPRGGAALYVVVTRAKDELHLMPPQRFYVHGQPAQGDRHSTRSAPATFRSPCRGCAKSHLAAPRPVGGGRRRRPGAADPCGGDAPEHVGGGLRPRSRAQDDLRHRRRNLQTPPVDGRASAGHRPTDVLHTTRDRAI